MQELVVESLMVSLAMVMLDVLVDDEAQMTLAEWDDSIETLLLDRPDEPLGIGIEIGTLRRKSDRLNAAARQDLAKDTSVKGISVVNQMPRSPQEAIARVGQIAGLLLHPRAARLRMDPGDGHAAGLQLDHEEDKIPPEPCQASLRSLRGGREIRVVRNNRDARLSIGWSIYLSTAKRFSPTRDSDTLTAGT